MNGNDGQLPDMANSATIDKFKTINTIDALLFSIFNYVLAKKRGFANPISGAVGTFFLCKLIHPFAAAFIATYISCVDSVKYNAKLEERKKKKQK